jgi:hypothetical protein
MLASLSVSAFFAITALLPTTSPKPPVVAYEKVLSIEGEKKQADQTPQDSSTNVPKPGTKEASKKAFPQPVTDFLMKHDGFSLKSWLDQLKPEYRQPFLNNLAEILLSAKAQNLTDSNTEQTVTRFAELWITALGEDLASRELAAKQKQEDLLRFSGVAFYLFIALMTVSLILVLLAIERNTRGLKLHGQVQVDPPNVGNSSQSKASKKMVLAVSAAVVVAFATFCAAFVLISARLPKQSDTGSNSYTERTALLHGSGSDTINVWWGGSINKVRLDEVRFEPLGGNFIVFEKYTNRQIGLAKGENADKVRAYLSDN